MQLYIPAFARSLAYGTVSTPDASFQLPAPPNFHLYFHGSFTASTRLWYSWSRDSVHTTSHVPQGISFPHLGERHIGPPIHTAKDDPSSRTRSCHRQIRIARCVRRRRRDVRDPRRQWRLRGLVGGLNKRFEGRKGRKSHVRRVGKDKRSPRPPEKSLRKRFGLLPVQLGCLCQP